MKLIVFFSWDNFVLDNSYRPQITISPLKWLWCFVTVTVHLNENFVNSVIYLVQDLQHVSFDELGNWICVHEGSQEPFLVSFEARSRKYSRPIKVFGIISCFPFWKSKAHVFKIEMLSITRWKIKSTNANAWIWVFFFVAHHTFFHVLDIVASLLLLLLAIIEPPSVDQIHVPIVVSIIYVPRQSLQDENTNRILFFNLEQTSLFTLFTDFEFLYIHVLYTTIKMFQLI